jgi:hypothetical protein
MRFFKILMVLFAFCSTALAANIDGVYIGTLGKSGIVLKLETEKNAQASGMYYYRNYAIDIRLEGKINKSSITLSEFGTGTTEPSASLFLSSAGNVLSGRWASIKQPKRFLAINLRRVTSKDLNAIKLPSTSLLNKWKLEQPFDYLRFNTPAKLVKTQTVNGKKVQWWLEPKSKIEFLRLPTESKTVNNTLTDAHYNLAITNLECLSSSNGEYSYEPKVALYSKRILSVSASVYYYCGGAHPDGGAENFNLDLDNGKALQIEDVYRFVAIPVGLKIDPSNDSRAYSKYQEARGAAVKKLILNQFGSFTQNLEKDCSDLYDDETFAYFSWYLTDTALVIESSFPHVAATCDSEFELPYKTIEQYLAPNSALK